MNKYYSGEQLVSYRQKRVGGKLPLFRGNVERVILIYAPPQTKSIRNKKYSQL